MTEGTILLPPNFGEVFALAQVPVALDERDEEEGVTVNRPHPALKVAQIV